MSSLLSCPFPRALVRIIIIIHAYAFRQPFRLHGQESRKESQHVPIRARGAAKLTNGYAYFSQRKSLATATNATLRWVHLLCIQKTAWLLGDWRLKVKEHSWKHSQFVTKTRRPRRQGPAVKILDKPNLTSNIIKTTLFRFVMKGKKKTTV